MATETIHSTELRRFCLFRDTALIRGSQRAFFSHPSSYPTPSPKAPKQQITEAVEEEVGSKACLPHRLLPQGHPFTQKRFERCALKLDLKLHLLSLQVQTGAIFYFILQGLGFLFVLSCFYFLIKRMFISTANEKHLFLQGPKR